MSERADHLTRFLELSKWRGAARTVVAGDASNRRYDRLKDKDGRTAILMDAPPEKGEDVRPFAIIAEHLNTIGLSAPVILEANIDQGFLIIEDLGDDLFARIMAKSPDRQTPLYKAATDVLWHLHQCEPPPLEPFATTAMAPMVDLAFSWYAAGADIAWQESWAEMESVFPAVLDAHVAPPSVFMHRDYHVENLLWLPDRSGVARVGLIDFQDAKLAHPAYDLVSLLQDARRDVEPEIETAMIAHYIMLSGQNAQDFKAAYHVLGAQRNLRILGVFARLCMHFGKPHYVDFIPRVYALLMRDLDHPALEPVAPLVRKAIPAPTSDVLKTLKDKCATYPTP